MRRRIMIVDDEAVIAYDIESIMREAGYEIVGVAADASTAIAQLERGGADLAILDADLGGESAAPVADRLRAANVPFIVVSGYSRQQINWIRSEFSILKPFMQENLLEAVRTAMTPRIAAV